MQVDEAGQTQWGCLKRNWNELGKFGIIYNIVTQPLSLPTLGEINYIILEPVMEKTFYYPIVLWILF